MTRLIYTFFLLIVLLACNGIDRPEKPDRLLSEEEMTNLLYDINLLQASRATVGSSLAKQEIHPDSFIYRKYGLDSLLLAQNISYYATEFSTLIRIQEEVEKRVIQEKDSLTAYRERLDSIEVQERKLQQERTLELEKKKRDSIAASYNDTRQDSL